MKKFLIPAVVLLILLLTTAIMVINTARDSIGDLPVLYQIPDFEFINQDNQPFGLEDLNGKLNVIDFIFTNCPGPCPVMSSKMSQLYEAYRRSDKIQFISVSVDPRRDSISVLKAYSKRYGIDDQRWQFIRGDMDEVIDLYENGFKLGGMLPAEHSTKFILADENGIIRGYYDSHDDISLSILKTHIRELAGGLM